MKNKGFRSFGRSLLCLCLGLLLGAAVMIAAAWLTLGENRWETVWREGLLPLFTGGWREGPLALLGRAAPDAVLSLGISLAWQGGIVQVGGAGLHALGAAAAMLCASLAGLPWYACLAVSALAGGLWGSVPGLLKVKLRLREALGTALTAWLAIYVLQAASTMIAWEQPAETDLFIPALAIAGVLALLIWLGVKFTVPGLDLRVLGVSEKTARYAGVDTGKTAFWALCLSGLLGGAAGGLDYLLGGANQLPDLSLALTGPGLHGLAAAALAGGHPLGAVAAAVAVKYLSLGAGTMNGAVFSPEMGEAILALILYCCAAFALGPGKGGRKA
ncbi:MAG: ABC transporter permease [Clostridia bacterium]|nr:ABC transporter permease [Clostridia bacterium]